MTTGHVVVIADRDQVIAAAGSSKKELTGKQISKQLETVINERENILAAKGDKQFIKVTEDNDEFLYEAVSPVICEGDAIGAVVLLTKEPRIKFGEVEAKLAATAANFLGRQMEQ